MRTAGGRVGKRGEGRAGGAPGNRSRPRRPLKGPLRAPGRDSKANGRPPPAPGEDRARSAATGRRGAGSRAPDPAGGGGARKRQVAGLTQPPAGGPAPRRSSAPAHPPGTIPVPRSGSRGGNPTVLPQAPRCAHRARGQGDPSGKQARQRGAGWGLGDGEEAAQLCPLPCGTPSASGGGRLAEQASPTPSRQGVPPQRHGPQDLPARLLPQEPRQPQKAGETHPQGPQEWALPGRCLCHLEAPPQTPTRAGHRLAPGLPASSTQAPRPPSTGRPAVLSQALPPAVGGPCPPGPLRPRAAATAWAHQGHCGRQVGNFTCLRSKAAVP